MKKRSAFSNLCYVIRSVNKSQRTFFLAIFVGVVFSVIQIICVDFIPSLVINVFEGKRNVSVLVLFLVGFCISSIINSVVDNSFDWFRFLDARFKFMPLHLSVKLNMFYEKLQTESVTKSEERAYSAVSDNESGIEGFLRSLRKIISSFISCLFVFLMLGLRYYIILVSTLVITVSVYLITSYFKKLDKRKNLNFIHEKYREEKFYNRLSSDFSYSKDIRVFEMENLIIKNKERLNKEVHEKVVGSNNIWIFNSLFNAIFMAVQEMVVFIVLITELRSFKIGISEFILYFSLYTSFCISLSVLFSEIATVRKQLDDINDYVSFIESNADNKDAKLESTVFKEIRLCNVSYKYENAKEYTLKNVNMSIKAGEIISLVGLNGAGKTTLIKILIGLLEPTEGVVLLNGKDRSLYKRDSYYDLFSPVFQDPALFAFTIMENICLCDKSKVDNVKFNNAIEDSGLNKRIECLKDGEETHLFKMLYKDGVDLSGGEKQKLAFSRALYKDAFIYVLDEPSSFMDALSEKRLYSSFNQILKSNEDKNHAVIYISHRMASSMFADKIIFLKNGMIAEVGSHDELVKMDGEYSHLFQSQKKYYEKDS